LRVDAARKVKPRLFGVPNSEHIFLHASAKKLYTAKKREILDTRAAVPLSIRFTGKKSSNTRECIV